MSDLIARLLELTRSAAQQLESVSQEEILELISVRDEALSYLEQRWEGFTPEEREVLRNAIREVTAYDTAIDRKLNDWRSEASLEMQKIGLIRKQRSAYQGYGPMDGLFFDEKK
jgi:TRAP-type C4-dicarboxylate transport system substrate-binding protein